MNGVWLFWKIFLLILLVGTGICIIMSAFITEKDYQDYWKKKELDRLLRGFDEDEVKFYIQIFNKIQQASNYIKFDMVDISFDDVKISFTDTHLCLTMEIIKDYRSDNVFIYPDDHNREVLNFLTKYAFDKAYKLYQIKVEKNQKELIEQNKQKIKKIVKQKGTKNETY